MENTKHIVDQYNQSEKNAWFIPEKITNPLTAYDFKGLIFKSLS